jgi:hypothetical protein
VYFSRFSIFIRAPENEDLDWETYLKPFSPKLWLAVAAAIPIFATLLSVAQYFEKVLLNEENDSSEVHFTFYNSIFYVFGAFCQQGKILQFIHSIRSLSYNRSIASSKASSPHSAI